MGLIKLPPQSIEFFKRNLDEIFETGNLAEGKWNKTLAGYINELIGAGFALPTSSNGSGIVALLSLYRNNFKRTKVLVQSNTMYGVKTMVPAGGCELAGFISCRISTLMPSIEDVKNAISNFSDKEKKQMIILLSHLGGIINPDIEQIVETCRNEDIILIEDCAHSFGATLNGKHSGLFGNAGVYSFYSTKAIPAGEGGCIVTNDPEIGEMTYSFSIYDRFTQKLNIGNNIRISEIQALLTYSVVSEWKEIIKNKSVIAEKYIIVCEELNINYISQEKDGQKGNYYKFVIYNEHKPILEQLKSLVTKTSPIYDYSIGVNNPLANMHACLPIWYGQEKGMTEKAIAELYDSLKK